jgi:hypothetical protein
MVFVVIFKKKPGLGGEPNTPVFIVRLWVGRGFGTKMSPGSPPDGDPNRF